MIGNLLMVALGGAIGSVARYAVVLLSLRLAGPGFPFGVLAVNVIGSFLMGVFFVLATQRGLVHLSPLVIAGLLGGFTTFSAFSLETMALVERGAPGLAAVFVVLSVGLSVGALVLGLMAAWGLA